MHASPCTQLHSSLTVPGFELLQTVSQYMGSASYIGSGAGRYPTAHSVVADLINIGKGECNVNVAGRTCRGAGSFR
jgi:hypothetical protein